MEHAFTSPVTPREDFHVFIDALDDDLVKPALHAVIDSLPNDLVHVALERMRALRARLSNPAELAGDPFSRPHWVT